MSANQRANQNASDSLPSQRALHLANFDTNRRKINSKLRHQFGRLEYRVYNQNYQELIRKLNGDQQKDSVAMESQQTMLNNRLAIQPGKTINKSGQSHSLSKQAKHE